MSPAPIHYESRRLDVAATAALVAKARASVVRASSAALDEIAAALPAPVRSIASSLAARLPRRHRPPASRAVRGSGRRDHVPPGARRARARSRLGRPRLRRQGRGRSSGSDARRAGRQGPHGPQRRWGHRGRTIGSRFPRRLWPAESVSGRRLSFSKRRKEGFRSFPLFIPHRGLAASPRVVPHNRRPQARTYGMGVAKCVCCCRRIRAERGHDRACGGDRRRRSDGADVGGRVGVGGRRRRHRRAARQPGPPRLARRRSALTHHRGPRSARNRRSVPLGGTGGPGREFAGVRLGHQRLSHPAQLRARAVAEPHRAHPGRLGRRAGGDDLSRT